jgi:hypothetical protein
VQAVACLSRKPLPQDGWKSSGLLLFQDQKISKDTKQQTLSHPFGWILAASLFYIFYAFYAFLEAAPAFSSARH